MLPHHEFFCICYFLYVVPLHARSFKVAYVRFDFTSRLAAVLFQCNPSLNISLIRLSGQMQRVPRVYPYTKTNILQYRLFYYLLFSSYNHHK